MKKNLAICVLLVVCLNACVTTQTGVKVEQSYVEVRSIWVTCTQQFLASFDQASVNTKREWANDIIPKLIDAEAALDLWGQAINLKQPTEDSMLIWIQAKNDLIMAMYKYNQSWFQPLK